MIRPALTVLVADDNEQSLELMRTYLAELPAWVVTAGDGIEAVSAAVRHVPDLIILDVMMPKMSGYQACRKIKSDPRTGEIPVLLVTALNEPEDVREGEEAGADGFLSKPVSRGELLGRVEGMIRGE